MRGRRVRPIATGFVAAFAVVALALAGVARAGELLAAGDPFPAWRMADQDGKQVASSSLDGRTYLLWFYPRAATPGCTAEGIGLRDRFAEFKAQGVEVVGVSFDPPAANAAFASEESFPFRLLSDDGTLAVAVGAATSSDRTARRISYLVGPDGKVLRVYADVQPAAHAGQVLGDLAAAKR